MAIRAAVNSLKPRLRDPLMLAASGEYSMEEIATMLGTPVGTVKWRVSEARRLTRDKLARMTGARSMNDEPGDGLDARIDRVLRQQTTPRPDPAFRARVLARIDEPAHAWSAWTPWLRRMAVPVAVVVVCVALAFFVRIAPEPPLTAFGSTRRDHDDAGARARCRRPAAAATLPEATDARSASVDVATGSTRLGANGGGASAPVTRHAGASGARGRGRQERQRARCCHRRSPPSRRRSRWSMSAPSRSVRSRCSRLPRPCGSPRWKSPSQSRWSPSGLARLMGGEAVFSCQSVIVSFQLSVLGVSVDVTTDVGD